MRLAVRERLQQHPVDDGENGSGGSNGQRESADDGEGVRPVAAKRADCIAEIKRPRAHSAFDGPRRLLVDWMCAGRHSVLVSIRPEPRHPDRTGKLQRTERPPRRRSSRRSTRLTRLSHILDLFAEDSWCRVYAGELEVRPPAAPTTWRR